MRYVVWVIMAGMISGVAFGHQSRKKPKDPIEEMLELRTLTAAQAEVLAEHFEGKSLSLDRLTALTPEVAAALAQHDGNLRLGFSLSEIGLEVAQALAKHRGNLNLAGLTFSPFLDPSGMLGFFTLASPERVGFSDGQEALFGGADRVRATAG